MVLTWISNIPCLAADAYLRNVADFLKIAAEHETHVFLTGFPPIPGYAERIPQNPQIDCPNTTYLTSGGVENEIRFWRDLIQGLADRDAPLAYVTGYTLRNEAFYWGDGKPFTLSSGRGATANGGTYDLADPAARQRMMDDNLIGWCNRVRAAILQIGPTALVGIGFFEPQGPNPARPAGQAVDGNLETWWSGGDFAPQWITIDLGEPAAVSQIRLAIAQDPPGETIHRVCEASLAIGHHGETGRLKMPVKGEGSPEP